MGFTPTSLKSDKILYGDRPAAFGRINAPFTSIKNKTNFEIYFYLQGLATIIGYDASLQGGLFNKKSPYVIANQNINRITFQNNLGITLPYKSLYLEYTRSELSKEFKTGKSHQWGGFRIGFKL